MKPINEDMTQSERAELWGRLIDVVEDWLEEKGFTPKDFPNDDRDFPIDPDEAIIFGEDYDILADSFAKVIGISRDCAEEGLKSQKESKAEKLANDILDFVNVFGFDSDTFAETISRGHRTLQQSTMRLFITTIKKMAEVYPDERNAATVELAKKITEIAKDYPLPFI